MHDSFDCTAGGLYTTQRSRNEVRFISGLRVALRQQRSRN